MDFVHFLNIFINQTLPLPWPQAIADPHLGTSAMRLPPMVFVIMIDGVKNWELRASSEEVTFGLYSSGREKVPEWK